MTTLRDRARAILAAGGGLPELTELCREHGRETGRAYKSTPEERAAWLQNHLRKQQTSARNRRNGRVRTGRDPAGNVRPPLTERLCMCCGRDFMSEGIGNRLCNSCR